MTCSLSINNLPVGTVSEHGNHYGVGFMLRAGAGVLVWIWKRIYMTSQARNDDKRSKLIIVTSLPKAGQDLGISGN